MEGGYRRKGKRKKGMKRVCVRVCARIDRCGKGKVQEERGRRGRMEQGKVVVGSSMNVRMAENVSSSS